MSQNDDGTGDRGERTLLRPRPGGRRAAAPDAPRAPDVRNRPDLGVPPAAPRPQPRPGATPPGPAVTARESQARAADRWADASASLDRLDYVGSSALSRAAAPLLVLVSKLRSLLSHADVDTLQRQLVASVERFEAEALAAGVPREHALTARYALCAALDEAVLSTPWGSQSIWSTHPLLATFHRETWGGEKFFQILDRIRQHPAQNLELLELMYHCLALGFEGKYRVVERGQQQLAGVQEELYRLIARQRGDFERQLSPHWHGVEERRNALVRHVPLWVVAAVLVAVLLGTFVSFRVSLARAAQPVDATLSGIGLPDVSSVPAVEVPDAQRLKPLLAAAESRGLLNAVEQGGVTIVTLRGDNLFASGSTTVDPQYLPVLAEIGRALVQVPGPVRVIGHTDNVPIRSFRFQSNWDLSRERAIGVAEILGQTIDAPSRLIPQGVADTLPVADNDTAAGRALNRRVEIVHTAQAAAQ